MKKTIVIYSSNYGSTKKYAEWIIEDLNGDIIDIKDSGKNNLSAYDTIILGSGLYAGNIKGINLLVSNYDKIKEKKIVIFTCGLADYSQVEHINTIHKRLEKQIPKNILEITKIFCLRGGIDYKGLNLIHKIMMGTMKKMIEKKGLDKLNEEDKEFLATYGQTLDFTDRGSIRELIEYCNKN